MTIERPIEVELKYRVRDMAAGERLLAADTLGPFRAISRAKTAQHEDRYLDTSDGAMARAGFAARLRQTNNATTVTVKSTEPMTDGLARREELEGPADRTSGPLGWPPSDARSLLLELCGDAPLVELVTVRQLRRKRRLKASDATVELSLDEVDVVARGRVIDRFVELEVELISGSQHRLAELGAVFDADPGLARATGSKLDAALAASSARDAPSQVDIPTALEVVAEMDAGAEQEEEGDQRGDVRDAETADATPGIAVMDPAVGTAGPVRSNGRNGHEPAAQPGPHERAAGAGVSIPVAQTGSPEGAPPAPPTLVVGKTPGVVGDDVVAEAGRKVLRFHCARMLAHEPDTRAGKDTEALHSMRVATRRMRAAWRVFGDGFRADRTRQHRRRLRAIAGRLGAVRDLDVLIEAGEHYLTAQGKSEQAALRPLFGAWREQRDEARTLLIRELDSDGYARWVDEFRDFVRTEGLAASSVLPTAPHRIRDTAGSRIWTAYEHVRAYEPVLRWADVPTLHELRIAGKWLRYTLEFVRECLGPEAALLIARVTALQDHLGYLHDADVAASKTRAFLVERAGRLSEAETAAIGRYLVDREREVGRLRRTVGTPWRGVAGPGFRRALGRAVAVL